MKKVVAFAILLLIGTTTWFFEQTPNSLPAQSATGDTTLESAYENRQSNVQIAGRGTVTRLLTDDNDGSRHQRFILELPSGLTLLVAHNIDLADRVPSLEVGDTVEFFGEYEWNESGGVIHWTHHDPAGRHVAGWLGHDGRTYR